MDIETQYGIPYGFVEFQWSKWNLMLAYDLFGWRLGFGYRNVGGPCFSLNLLCFDVHLHS